VTTVGDILRRLRCTVLGTSSTIAVVVLTAINFAVSIFVQYNIVNLLLAPWLLLLVNGQTTCAVSIMMCIAVLLSLVIKLLVLLFALLEPIVLIVVLEARLLG